MMWRRVLVVTTALAALGVPAALLLPQLFGGDGQPDRAADAEVLAVELGAWETPLRSCLQQSDQPGSATPCVRELVHQATDEGDYGAALAALRVAVEEEPDMVGRCHNETHLVGEEAVASGFTLQQVYEVPFADCRFGFYHGGLATHTEELDLEQLSSELGGLCDYFGGADSEAAQECVHVLGHFVYDRTDDDVAQAMQVCELYPDGELAARCVDGVLMQATDLVRSTISDDGQEQPFDQQRAAAIWGDSREQQQATLLDTCASLDIEYVAYVCYTNVPQTAFVLWDGDRQAVAESCLKVEEKTFKRACFEGVAASALGSIGWDPQEIAASCHAIDHEFSRYCMKSMAFSFGLQDTPERAARVCELAMDHELDDCQRGLQRGQDARAQLERDTGSAPPPPPEGAPADQGSDYDLYSQ